MRAQIDEHFPKESQRYADEAYRHFAGQIQPKPKMHITAPTISNTPNLPAPSAPKAPGGNQTNASENGSCSMNMGGNQPAPATATVGTRVNVKV